MSVALVLLLSAALPALPSTIDDDGGEPLTLAQAFAILKTDSPRSKAERAQVDVARADVLVAQTLPNPSLDYEGTRLRSGTNTGAATTDEWSAELPLLVFGQRRARRDAALGAADAVAAHVEADYAERARALRHAFIDDLAQQERVRILAEQRADLEHAATIVSGRKDAGEASEYDALRVETEFRSLDAELGDARGDLADARGRLATLLGRPDWSPRAVGGLQPATIESLDAESLWPSAADALPALAAARKDEEAAAAQEHAAHREWLPVPVLSGGSEVTNDASSTSTKFGLTIPLPILDHGRGPVARARAQRDAAGLERAAATAEARADLERVVEVARKRRAALATLDATVSPRLPELRSMAEAAYREGRSGIVDLLDALRSLTSTRLAHLDALQAVAHGDADLLFLLGRADEAP